MTLDTVIVPAATEVAEDRLELDALVHGAEAPAIPAYAAPRAAALLLVALALLLSAEPDGDEPVEDAHGGVVQNLACAKVF